MATKSLTCPHCKKELPSAELCHDANLNLICNFCKKIIFGVTPTDDLAVQNFFRGTSGTAMGFQSWGTKEPLPIKLLSTEITEDEVRTEEEGVEEFDPNAYGCFC